MHTSVNIITESLGRAEEDTLVRKLPQVLPVKPLAAACQLLNGALQLATLGSSHVVHRLACTASKVA